MPEVILTATTSADQSDAVIVDTLRLPATFYAPGIAGAETATLQQQDASGSWHDYYVDGTVQDITATNTSVAVYAPGIYRVDKDATAASVPIELSDALYP